MFYYLVYCWISLDLCPTVCRCFLSRCCSLVSSFLFSKGILEIIISIYIIVKNIYISIVDVRIEVSINWISFLLRKLIVELLMIWNGLNLASHNIKLGWLLKNELLFGSQTLLLTRKGSWPDPLIWKRNWVITTTTTFVILLCCVLGRYLPISCSCGVLTNYRSCRPEGIGHLVKRTCGNGVTG